MLVVWRCGWVRLALQPVRQLLIFGDKEARGRVAGRAEDVARCTDGAQGPQPEDCSEASWDRPGRRAGQRFSLAGRRRRRQLARRGSIGPELQLLHIDTCGTRTDRCHA